MALDPEVILFYTIGFFIYFNIKVALFLVFFKSAKKIMKKGKRTDKKAELSDEELRKWYENSTFKRISKIEYSEDMVKLMRTIYESNLNELTDDNPHKKIHKTPSSPSIEKIQLGNLTIVKGLIPRYMVKKPIIEDENPEEIDKGNNKLPDIKIV
ncbi:MAG: hypothetical protein HY934_06020 [Candidatus Firestonebacteria bacterium]|nr:hypothetical protein [Candidatus Firestonebacteria bacterium]